MTEIDKYGRIRNRNFQRQPLSSFPSFHDDDDIGLWQRLDRFVANIGYWLSENRDSICNNISIGAYLLCWGLFAFVVISVWVNEGFFSALLAGLLGGFIVYYAAAILMFIILFALQIIFRLLRVLFISIYHLLLGIALLVYFLFFRN